MLTKIFMNTWVIAVGILFSLLRWTLQPLPTTPPDRYSGAFGNATDDLIPYDRMTMAEHDEAGGFWVWDANLWNE